MYWQICKIIKQPHGGAIYKRILSSRTEEIPVPTEKQVKEILIARGEIRGIFAVQVNKGKGRGGWTIKYKIVLI